MPKNLDNSNSITSQRVKSFANILNDDTENNHIKINNKDFLIEGYDIFFWDERFSSRAASKVSIDKTK